jgi:hypothetical protein
MGFEFVFSVDITHLNGLHSLPQKKIVVSSRRGLRNVIMALEIITKKRKIRAFSNCTEVNILLHFRWRIFKKELIFRAFLS